MFEGEHPKIVQKLLKHGMLYFIVSEVCFFGGFFMPYLSGALVPPIELGALWPPVGGRPIATMELPLLNTLLLLTSGFSYTLAHHALMNKNKRIASWSLFITIILNVVYYKI